MYLVLFCYYQMKKTVTFDFQFGKYLRVEFFGFVWVVG